MTWLDISHPLDEDTQKVEEAYQTEYEDFADVARRMPTEVVVTPPHIVRGFKVSRDPKFVEKLEDIVAEEGACGHPERYSRGISTCSKRDHA